MSKIAVLGSGVVGQVLADGLLAHGHEVMRASREPGKLASWKDQFGWDTADMGKVEAARAIEPLCMLWCIPGLAQGRWAHAFKLLRL